MSSPPLDVRHDQNEAYIHTYTQHRKRVGTVWLWFVGWGSGLVWSGLVFCLISFPLYLISVLLLVDGVSVSPSCSGIISFVGPLYQYHLL